MSLHDLFKFVLGLLDGKNALQAEDVPHLWNTIINKPSEVEEQGLRDTGVARYSSKNQLLMYHLVHDDSKLIYPQ